jgi:hypothetical protein
MMADTDLQTIVDGLIDAWCERRALAPLRILLPAWPMPMGLTDDWHTLRDALRHVRAMAKDVLTEDEKNSLNTAIALVDQAIFGR